MTFLKYLIPLLICLVAPSPAQAASCNGPNSLVRVSNSSIGGFEYVNFKFKTPDALQFFTTNVMPPFVEDPSDLPIHVNGGHWTKIQFRGVDVFCSIPQYFSLPRPAIKDIKKTEQFEGQISFVIGRSATSHYIFTKAKAKSGFTLIRVKFRP
jgi:hypothetical protein